MIIELLAPAVLEFLKGIEELGFSLCAVGGLPRDFFHSKIIGNDFDFEIRPSSALKDPILEWPEYYKKLHQFLNHKKIPFSELPYLITRVNFYGIDFEFSSPRVEKNLKDNFTHHHFEAVLDPNLTYEISFRRRDFTINAIGVEFQFANKKERVVDPYLGMSDLTHHILRPVSEDFFLDSVRFLRLIRFQLKFDQFIIEEKLKLNLKKFNLTKISIHHFQEELFKAAAYFDHSLAPFLNLFKELVLTNGLILSDDFKIWTRYLFPNSIKEKDGLLAFVFIQNEGDAQKIAQFFSLPEKKLKDLKSFMNSYQNIKKFKVIDFQNLIKSPMDEVLEHKILKDLKNLEEKKYWWPFVKTEVEPLFINWSDWENEKISPDELAAIKPTHRSYYLFYKTLKKKFSHG